MPILAGSEVYLQQSCKNGEEYFSQSKRSQARSPIPLAHRRASKSDAMRTAPLLFFHHKRGIASAFFVAHGARSAFYLYLQNVDFVVKTTYCFLWTRYAYSSKGRACAATRPGRQMNREENDMKRRIIHIDEEKCNGCGLCATACHEGAIDIINGKAKLVRENFCDGFGDCLPGCPTGAITFEEREAPAYDEAAVQENKKKKELQEKMKHLHEGGCPGSRMRMLEQPEAAESAASAPVQPVSRLRNWPVQIKLAPVHAPYFEGAKLLIAADCTAYAYANFHQEFMRGKVTLIGCPKLDAVDYSEKLTEILRSNDIQSVTILRMEVPCCGGLEMAAKKALQASGKFIPWQVVTISIDGKILD